VTDSAKLGEWDLAFRRRSAKITGPMFAQSEFPGALTFTEFLWALALVAVVLLVTWSARRRRRP